MRTKFECPECGFTGKTTDPEVWCPLCGDGKNVLMMHLPKRPRSFQTSPEFFRKRERKFSDPSGM
jgi:hypothetical protein